MVRLKVSRTKIAMRGRRSRKRILNAFESIRKDRRAGVCVKYDKSSNLTDITIAPCRVVEEIVPIDGDRLTSRIMFELDRSAMPDILAKDDNGCNKFIEQVWVPFRKSSVSRNVVLPSIYARDDYFYFELISCQGYSENVNGIKYRHDASIPYRNANMEKAKKFLMDYFAEQVEAESSKSAARILDEVSMDLSEELIARRTNVRAYA